jgi:RNA polymerase sigma-70 factor (ECF subfamily)
MHACEPAVAIADERLDDGELLEDLAHGKVIGLEILYDRYAGVAFGLAYRLLNDRRSAEDAVQESFVQVWRAAGRYDARRGTLRTWLLSIVHHRCIDILRQRGAQPRTVSWAVESADLPDARDVWEEVAQRLTREDVQSALRELPPKQRETIELAFFRGYTHAEIADHLGLPIGTVKGRIRLGLQGLRGLLVSPSPLEGEGQNMQLYGKIPTSPSERPGGSASL